MKKCRRLLLLLLLCLVLTGVASASYIKDEAGLLTASQEKDLEDSLERLSDELGLAVFVVTQDSTGGRSVSAAANAAYDASGYGDGIALYIAMEGRDCYLVTDGRGRDVFDPALEDIEDAFLDALSEGDYHEAFLDFGEACKKAAKGPGFSVVPLLVCLVIGLVLALLIPMSYFKGQLKSVRRQTGARPYVESFRLTQQRDVFLYHRVTRVPIPKNNTSSGGGGRSGGSRGGRGGKF